MYLAGRNFSDFSNLVTQIILFERSVKLAILGPLAKIAKLAKNNYFKGIYMYIVSALIRTPLGGEIARCPDFRGSAYKGFSHVQCCHYGQEIRGIKLYFSSHSV